MAMRINITPYVVVLLLNLLSAFIPVCLSLECKFNADHYVEINTDYGLVRGCTIPTRSHVTPNLRINMFLGIPYAKGPADWKKEEDKNTWQTKFRFKRPARMERGWDGVYDATYYRPACPQMLWYIRETVPNFSDTDEDCLYLNIFAPNHTLHRTDSTKYPVMVFIHGGGFTMGSARQWPAMMIAEQNVVVVTINYRLGPLGFLSTGDSASPGNYGLWDQYEALYFIKHQIAAFKGDPRRVTLVGHSAGAASAGFHLLSPHTLARNLNPDVAYFHKIVYMSGSDLNDWAIIKKRSEALTYAKDLGSKLGCPISSNYEMIRCLQMDRSPEEIVKAAATINVRDSRLGNPWAPVVDGFEGADTGYIIELPSLARTSVGFSHVRVMGGICKDEGSWYIHGTKKAENHLETTSLAPC